MWEKPDKLKEFFKDEAMVAQVTNAFEEYLANLAWEGVKSGKDVSKYNEGLVNFTKFSKEGVKEVYEQIVPKKKTMPTLAR